MDNNAFLYGYLMEKNAGVEENVNLPKGQVFVENPSGENAINHVLGAVLDPSLFEPFWEKKYQEIINKVPKALADNLIRGIRNTSFDFGQPHPGKYWDSRGNSGTYRYGDVNDFYRKVFNVKEIYK